MWISRHVRIFQERGHFYRLGHGTAEWFKHFSTAWLCRKAKIFSPAGRGLRQRTLYRVGSWSCPWSPEVFLKYTYTVMEHEFSLDLPSSSTLKMEAAFPSTAPWQVGVGVFLPSVKSLRTMHSGQSKVPAMKIKNQGVLASCKIYVHEEWTHGTKVKIIYRSIKK